MPIRIVNWQGSNGNLNGLIQLYLPKEIVLDSISDEDIKAVEHRLNHLSSKRLSITHLIYQLDSHLDVEFSYYFILKRMLNLKLLYKILLLL